MDFILIRWGKKQFGFERRFDIKCLIFIRIKKGKEGKFLIIVQTDFFFSFYFMIKTNFKGLMY